MVFILGFNNDYTYLLTAHNWQKWKSIFLTCSCHEIYRVEADGLKSSNPGGGGHSTFFQVGVCGPDFRSVGLANGHLPLKRAGLWAENFQIWGLVSWKFPNLGACELKISKFEGLWAENIQIWGLVSWKFPNLGACELKFEWKLRLLRLKFPNFLKRGSCELTLLLEMGPLRAAGEAWKGGLQGRTSPYPFLGQCPPPPGVLIILEKLRFLWICEIWGSFVKNWYFVNNCLIKVRI